MSRPLDSARTTKQLQAAPANLIEEATNLRVVAPLEGRGQSIKEGYLKKINSLTSARLYFVLDFETLTWWPDKKDAGPLKEVDGKHRLLLRQIVAVIGTKNSHGDEFEITYAQGEGSGKGSREEGGKGGKEQHRSVVLRSDKGEGRQWVSAILTGKVELSRHIGAAMSTWLRKLNGCQVAGCEQGKLVRGFCAQHFRLFFGEDPHVELARAEMSQECQEEDGEGGYGGGDGGGGGPSTSGLKKDLHLCIYPRSVGRSLGLELSASNVVIGLTPGSLAEAVAKGGNYNSLQLGDECVGTRARPKCPLLAAAHVVAARRCRGPPACSGPPYSGPETSAPTAWMPRRGCGCGTGDARLESRELTGLGSI